MPFVEHDGNRLYYEDSGGDGPTILMSHGAFLDHTIWEHVVSALAPEFRCITWDERGHGMSGSNGTFTYWDAAADAIAILDAAGVDRAVLVGMSQGGWLSQRAALAAPERVRALLLTGTSVRLLAEEEQAGYAMLSRAWLENGPVGEVAAQILGIQVAPSDYDASRYVDRWQSKPPAAWADVWRTILDRDDILDRFPKISCPVLFVHGTDDQAFPLSAAEEMAAMLPDSRGVRAVEGGTHCIALTHPTAMISALRDFVPSLD